MAEKRKKLDDGSIDTATEATVEEEEAEVVVLRGFWMLLLVGGAIYRLRFCELFGYCRRRVCPAVL